MTGNNALKRGAAWLLSILIMMQMLPIGVSAEGWDGYSGTSTGELEKPEYYSVCFMLDGQEFETVFVPAGTAYGELPQAPDKAGYVFDGWYNGDAKVKSSDAPASSLTLTGRYTRTVSTQTLTGETALGLVTYATVSHDTTLPGGAQPTAEEFCDAGVLKQISAGGRYSRILAQTELGLSDPYWRQQEQLRVTVTLRRPIPLINGEEFVLVGEEGKIAKARFTAAEGKLQAFSFPANSLGRFSLIGLYSENTAVCTVTFLADDKTLEARSVICGQPIGAFPAAPEKEGYAFAGWVCEGIENIGEDTVAAGDLTVYASYTASENTRYPAFTADAQDGGISVHIEAPEGALPAGVRFLVRAVDGESLRGAVQDAMGGQVGRIMAADLSFTDADGHEIQPLQSVTVRITVTGMDGAERLSVVHFAADGSAEVVHTGSAENARSARNSGDGVKTVTFRTGSFSVYAVVEGTGPEARMTVNFISGANTIATMYVKNSDTLDELETILYDPGVGTLGEGELFLGWILDNASFTTADLDGVMNIEEVREWARDEAITEGDTHNLYAAICKMYTITYWDYDDNDQTQPGAVVGMDGVPVKSDEYGTAVVDYTVNMSYALKDDMHNFEGWILQDDSISNVVEPTTLPDDNVFDNGAGIKIKGNIKFMVNAPEGAWLIFDENGKGATYNAPQFVKAEETTRQPRPDTEMIRNGYTFGGWYDTKAHADAHAANPSVTTGKFVFGSELSAKTTIYASWIPNETAPYTVIMWGERLKDGKRDEGQYEVLDSYVNNGRVGQNIPYTSVENGDEDYATGLSDGKGHYTGFNLTAASKNQQVTITPEGDAVLNLYYDRIHYNFKFYLYRDGTQNNRYDYANNSGTGSDLNGLVTWHTNQTQHPSVTGYTITEETVGGRRYHYFILSAYYGETISEKWPTYDKLTGANNREAVSYVMMVGTKLKPNPTDQGSGTVKGIITVLNENILGATNNENGNYVVIRFPGGTVNNWRYHIWFETVEGEDYTGKTLHTQTIDGVERTYYEDTVLVVRSSNTTDANQNEPKYPGYDYITRLGQNNSGTVWQGGHWTTNENGTTLYHLNYIYNRQKFPISYFDGQYFDGDGNKLENRASHLLHESEEIIQGQIIEDEYKNYKPQQVSGYVFDGWYLDEACNTPYTWSTMPIGGIKVYAKWIQIEYRVLMHPNAGNDPNLDWGSENVKLSFRASYGEKVSTPTGTREGSGFAFYGWYTDPSLESQYLYKSEMVLNDQTVTTQYDQTDDTELDKWGNPNPEGYNKDSAENRFWITRKLELWAKWRKILEGADGVRVIYSPVDDQGRAGSNEPVDMSNYPDQTEVTAQAACKAPAGSRLSFKHWVVQKWNGTAYEDTEVTVLPGQKFTIIADDARKEGPDQQGNYTYTIQLRAEYAEPGTETPTHIWWFLNYPEDDARHDSFRQDEDIQINKGVSIEEAPTRDGYTFLGWARIPVAVSESAAGTEGGKPTGKVLPNLGENDVYLKYVNGGYVLNDSGNAHNGAAVTQVAADEKSPYHDMYAVWSRDIDVTVQKIWQSGNFANQVPETLTVELKQDGNSFNPPKTAVLNAAGDWTHIFEGLPSHNASGKKVKYSVVEVNPPAGWTATCNHDHVSVPGNNGQNPQPLQITNTPVYGKITLVKHIAGPTEDFSTVFPNLSFTLKGPKQSNGTYKNTYNFTFSQFNNSGETFSGQYTLDHNQLAFVEPGEYIYYEGNANLLTPWGYSVNTENPGTTGDVHPVTFSLSAGGDAQPAITNQYTRDTGTLVINKKVTGHELGAWPYKVKIQNSEGWWLKQDLTLTNAEAEAYEFTITGTGTQGTLTLQNVPTGTYTVIEQGTGEGGAAQITNYTLEVSYNPADATVTVKKNETDETATVTVTNAYTPSVTDVTLTKQVTGNLGDVTKDFTFTVTIDGNAVTITKGGTETATAGTVTLHSGESAVLKDVPIGATVTVVESGAGDYTTTAAADWSGAPAITVTASGENRTFTFTVPETTGTNTVTVTNNKEMPPPPMGVGLDRWAYVTLLCLALVMCASLTADWRKENLRERE